MQTDYLFNGIKGYTRVKRFSYLFEMENKEASKRYKILQWNAPYNIDTN